MAADLLLRVPGRALRSRIRIASGALDRLGALTRESTGARRVVIVTDRRVGGLYAARARRSLRRAGLDVLDTLAVPPGERSKSPARLVRLWERFAALGIRRSDAVVALGGGVVGDLAGFAAATWLRGVPWVCVPTTLLAQVDSSVGGKTAVDLAAGKNLPGAFHQPAGVLVDPTTLATLPARHVRAGMAEVVKMGMAVDAPLFRWLEREAERVLAGHRAPLEEAIVRSVRAKARVVAADERERGPRTALNFGHTVGHALESATGYRGLLHGEAVAIGMRVAAAMSERRAGLPTEDRERLERLLARCGLLRRFPRVRADAILDAMERDKKRAEGVRWVLTPRVGHASVPRLISRRLARSALLEAGAIA